MVVSIEYLWRTYMDNYTDMSLDDPEMCSASQGQVNEVADALLINSSISSIQKLFRDGMTFMLLGAIMNELDKPNILREIVIENGEENIVIGHEDINF